MDRKILVVDDESKIRSILRQTLVREGYEVVEAGGGREALEMVESERPCLILLDIMMPDMDGFEVLKELRKSFDTPVIILSAKDDLIDKAVGFTLGVDDYVAKPFSPLELKMRVKAVLRRTARNGNSEPNTIKIGETQIDFLEHRFTVAGKSVDLTPSEFKLIGILMRNAGKVMTREQLLLQLNESEYFGDLNVINVFIRRLRQKIEKDPSCPSYLLTVRGVGYKYRN